jgi:hypothetical protein
MSNSYRTLIERLRQFADGHYIIQKFYHGQIDAADLDKEPRYPMMHVLPVDIRASEGTLDYALEIRFADIGRDKEIKTDYQKEIISDMSRLALSLISEIENGQVLFGEDAEIVDKQATIIPFIEEFTHVLTGVQLNVTIRLPYNWSACDIPADYSPNITDNPDTGSGILTKIGVYNDGDFVGYTSFLDFSDDFNVTVNGNKIEVTLAGGGGGAGTLQETTDLGNTTTNDIQLIDAAEVIFGAGGGVLLDNDSRLREGTIDAGTGGSNGIALICGVGYELKWEAGSQYVMNGNGDNIRIVNYKFNIVPSATDDSSSGFYVGSKWILDDGDIYVCTDSTIGAAVWEIETYADWNATSGSREIANKPTIPTLTSDLTNDGEDGTNPFITALDLGSYGDMFKSTYDTDNDGIVDSAETVQIIVRNSTGSTLTKGQVVYLSGATGNRPNAVLAQANTEASSDKTIGVVVANIANNADGQIAVSGTLHNLDTSAFTAGDAVWLSAATAGAITATAPAEPNHTVFIGYIARAHPTQGRLVIAIQNGYELDDIHGVLISSPANNQGLIYNSTTGLWENKNIPNVDLSSISVTETSARLDNWTPTGWTNTAASVIKVIKLNANYVDKVQVISGLTDGTSGRIVTITNTSTDNLVILELNSTNSLAANRFKFLGRGAYFLFPNDDITLLHNGVQWSQLSGNTKNGHTLFDDMGAPNHLNVGINTSYFGEAGYGIASGTGALVRNETPMTNSIGTIGLTTGTLAIGYAKIVMNGRGGTGFGTGSTLYNQYAVVTRLRLEALPTALQDFRFQTGLVAVSNSAAPSMTGLMGWYCTSANANWKCYAANTSSTIVSDVTSGLPIVLNADIVLATYHPNPQGDTVFVYSSDGGMTYTVDSRFVRVTSNYGGAPVVGLSKILGITSITADIDYIGLTIKGAGV